MYKNEYNLQFCPNIKEAYKIIHKIYLFLQFIRRNIQCEIYTGTNCQSYSSLKGNIPVHYRKSQYLYINPIYKPSAAMLLPSIYKRALRAGRRWL